MSSAVTTDHLDNIRVSADKAASSLPFRGEEATLDLLANLCAGHWPRGSCTFTPFFTPDYCPHAAPGSHRIATKTRSRTVVLVQSRYVLCVLACTLV